MNNLAILKAVTFDVFGTVVDWRTSIAREVENLAVEKKFVIDGERFADAWRKLYQPSMTAVRDGKMPWTILDDLHRMNLLQVLEAFGVDQLSEEEIEHLNRVWHRLDPWPDAVAGLQRLKQHYIIGSLSNGNVALIVNMAKFAGLPWDVGRNPGVGAGRMHVSRCSQWRSRGCCKLRFSNGFRAATKRTWARTDHRPGRGKRL